MKRYSNICNVAGMFCLIKLQIANLRFFFPIAESGSVNNLLQTKHTENWYSAHMTVIPFLCHVNSQCDTSWCSVVEWQHQSGGNVSSNASKCWQSWQIKGSFSVLQSLFGPSMEKQHPHWAQYGWIKAWDLQSSKVGKLGMAQDTSRETRATRYQLDVSIYDMLKMILIYL